MNKEDRKFVGTLPPTGYNEWHEWAEIQHRAGLRQVQCGFCGLWKFPQELSSIKHMSRVWDSRSRGNQVMIPYRKCHKCEGNGEEAKQKPYPGQCTCLNGLLAGARP